MNVNTAGKTLHIGHSPDPDDAFMWYPLANFPDGSGPGGKTYTPQIDTRGYDFVHVLEDIQSLNERSDKGELEITALSIHQYPYVADKYVLTSCGSSMGDGYGPMVVARSGKQLKPGDLTDIKIAVPGERTSAFLTLSLLMGQRIPNYEVVPFDQIQDRVATGEFAAGLIIHEGQLTYRDSGLSCVVDLGRWWSDSRGLPLPLGGNAIRRDLGDEMPAICSVLLDSINYALSHREESVEYALNYARNMGSDLADRFVGMYVNHWTLDYTDRGRAAVNQLLGEAAEMGLIPNPGEIEFIDPA